MTRPEQYRAVVARVAHERGINPAAIYGWSKQRDVVRARDAVIAELSSGFALCQSEIARFLGLNPSSVWAAMNRETKRARNLAWRQGHDRASPMALAGAIPCLGGPFRAVYRHVYRAHVERCAESY